MIRPALLLGAIVLAIVAAGTARQGIGSPMATSWLRAPARTLAALDCRCTPGTVRIARYQRLLDTLATRCLESRGRLAYVSKTATGVLRQAGHRRTNLWMLNEVVRTISPGKRAKQPCRYVFGFVVESIV